MTDLEAMTKNEALDDLRRRVDKLPGTYVSIDGKTFPRAVDASKVLAMISEYTHESGDQK